MSVSIKVCVRCRPFTIDDKLGVVMLQSDEENGEVNLINSQYSTNRFAFTYSWWSAYGYQRHVLGNPPEVDSMELIDQSKAYESCGLKIKEDLLNGNAVVLFAYGLSGSGKTFTVFGPDAVDIPEAWFKHTNPHPLWGIFPRLAYDIFKMKEDGWKITMKYFQNVVDTVRDLMSPMAKEMQYKAGMKKDADGFTDIEWCQAVVLNTWDDLRKTFMAANSRKAIAPTQFNHQSTRGHCIMTLEIEKPDPERPGMKQRGRIYVCDLAGTEPAGDIVFAQYEKVVFPNGDIEHKYLGPHQDASKSKELQDQGKKINLSLTEMSQFFMKMAEAVQKKKLKPGCSIPGCNSYFLCKYLKDTMLQARTYLFCAIRPEVTYHNYTFSTLGFAKNASVIKLQPKKATTAASAAERRLMAELEQMKLLVEQLKQANLQMASGGGSEEVDRLNTLLHAKQAELQNHLSGGGNSKTQEDIMQRQRDEYAERGISLTHYEEDTQMPYLINIDVDEYRSKRFMIIFTKENTKVGSKADVQLMSLTLVPDHCMFIKENLEIDLVGGKGDTYHNGVKVGEGVKVSLVPNDRVVIANELFLFQYPGKESTTEEPTADDAVKEYQKALHRSDDAAQEALREQMRRFEQEKKDWELRKANETSSSGEQDKDSTIQDQLRCQREQELIAKQVNDQELRDVLPKIQELTQIVKLFNRGMLSFETTLQGSGNNKGVFPKVKVKVHNTQTQETIFLDVFEFTKAHAILKDELQFIQNALSNDREYVSPKAHDPITILFDNSFHIGSATSFPEYLIYNLETDVEESQLSIKLAVPPFNTIGKLEVLWKPIVYADEDGKGEVEDVEDPNDLIGKSWTYEITIKGATGLPMITDLAYCQYEFFGETFVTESVEQNTRSPVFDYKNIHHIDCVTQQFVDYLMKERMEFAVYISPYVMDSPKDEISTSNSAIVANLGGTPVVRLSYDELKEKVKSLETEKEHMQQEINMLKEQLQLAMKSATVCPKESNLSINLEESESNLCTPRDILQKAIATDAHLNL